MNHPLLWAITAITAVTVLCATHPRAWRTILTDCALCALAMTAACAPLIIRS